MKHIDIRDLWLQKEVRDGKVALSVAAGDGSVQRTLGVVAVLVERTAADGETMQWDSQLSHDGSAADGAGGEASTEGEAAAAAAAPETMQWESQLSQDDA